ncbi:MAG: GNAT family N-acetyltransferase [Pirellulaceae bacterium]
MFVELYSDRLELLRFDQCDVDGYTLLLTDANTHPYIIDDGPVDPASVPIRIKKNCMATRFGQSLYWTARSKGCGEFVGFVALHSAKSKHPVLSYAVLPKWRRQGYASEAIRAVADFAIVDIGKQAILARTHLNNQASQSLLRSLGFTLAGEIDWSDAKRLEYILRPDTM